MKRLRISVSGRLSSIAEIMARQEDSPIPEEETIRRCIDLLHDDRGDVRGASRQAVVGGCERGKAPVMNHARDMDDTAAMAETIEATAKDLEAELAARPCPELTMAARRWLTGPMDRRPIGGTRADLEATGLLSGPLMAPSLTAWGTEVRRRLLRAPEPKRDYPPRGTREPTSEDREIFDLHCTGLSWSEVAARTGRSTGFCQQAVNRVNDARRLGR